MVEGFNWTEISNSLVVNIDGSHDSRGIKLTQCHPGLHCILRDKREVVTLGKRNSPESLEHRVEMMEHEPLDEQAVKGSSMNLLR